MYDALLQLALFSAKSIIVFIFIVLTLLAFFILLAKSRHKPTGKLRIKNLNEKYAETNDLLMEEILPKKAYKQFLKNKKAERKANQDKDEQKKNIFVVTFNGDIKASAVNGLSEEITAILNAAKPQDEVVVRIDSPGGMVSGYGLGAAQLMRVREHQLALTVTIDKVAASGGYLMACTANKILAAPFAIIGSIGVVIQFPNFHRLLKHNHIDFEMQTAGEFKRTVTMFGENTEAGRAKLQEEIDQIHLQFKELIKSHRPQINLPEVATGEYWLAQQALPLNLVDGIQTSDEYLLNQSKLANIFEISYEERKPLLAKLTETAKLFYLKLTGLNF